MFIRCNTFSGMYDDCLDAVWVEYGFIKTEGILD